MNATAIKKSNNIIEVTTLYSEHSDARGALFDFVFIDDDGDVDFTRSVLLALDRNTSLHHTLPFNLYPGQYRVFVYDIESDGTLSNGVGYPAVTKKLESQGIYYLALSFIQKSSQRKGEEVKVLCPCAQVFRVLFLSRGGHLMRLHVQYTINYPCTLS